MLSTDHPSHSPNITHDVVCVGGAVINRKYHSKAPLIPGTSNPAITQRTFGGVARNVAETLARLQKSVRLVSLVGDDEAGRAIHAHMAALGVDMRQTGVSPSHATAEYAAVLDKSGELHLGLAAMDIFEAITPAALDKAWPSLAASHWVFADCNLPEATLHALMERKEGAMLAINTVSVPKAVRLPDDLSAVDLLFTNADEARAMLCETSESLECLTAGLRHRGAKSVVLTLGSDGHLVADATGSYQFEAIPAETVDVTGAGDALMAGTLCGFMQGKALAEASIVGAVLAHLTVQSPLDVPADLSPALLEAATNTSPPATVTRLT